MSELDFEEVIVVAKHKDLFRWFKSNRDYWVLDWKKWTQEFIDAGYQVPEADPSERFGIPVVNEETAERFMGEMQQFEVSKEDLANQLILLFPHAQSWWDVGELFPIMFVDFDRRHVCAFYPEGTRMERYIPDGWTSEFEDFLTKYSEENFPQREKFWVQDNLDMLKELNNRGSQLS